MCQGEVGGRPPERLCGLVGPNGRVGRWATCWNGRAGRWATCWNGRAGRWVRLCGLTAV